MESKSIDPALVPELPTQADYVLALWREDGWYAHTTLHHDGTPRDIELSPPARLFARIVDETGPAVEGARVCVRFDDVAGSAREARLWNCTPTTSDADGRVELVAPTGVKPLDLDRLAPMPHVCRVTFEAAFHEPLSLETPLDPGVRHDLGRLVLHTRAPGLVVEFSGPVPELLQVAWEVDNEVRSPAVVRVRARSENTLEFELEAQQGQERPQAEGLVLFTYGGAMSARRSEERYLAQPTRTLRCAVDMSELDPPPWFVQVGVRIGAVLQQVTGSFREDVLGADHSIDAVVPAEGVELFWREQDDAQQYGAPHALTWPSPGDSLRLVR